MAKTVEPRAIGDDEVVSHLVSRTEGGAVRALASPRPVDQGRLSVVIGELTAADAVRLAFRRPAIDTDGVRHARVGDLRAAGFEVIHTPTRMNPEHASIQAVQSWVDRSFTECFDEIVWEASDE